MRKNGGVKKTRNGEAMKKVILAVLCLLVVPLALGQELSEEKQAELERQKLYEQWNLFRKEITNDVFCVLDDDNTDKTPEDSQHAYQRMGEIIANELIFVEAHNRYFVNMVLHITA